MVLNTHGNGLCFNGAGATPVPIAIEAPPNGAGTVTATVNSATVTGLATVFTGLAGQFIQIPSVTGRWYKIVDGGVGDVDQHLARVREHDRERNPLPHRAGPDLQHAGRLREDAPRRAQLRDRRDCAEDAVAEDQMRDGRVQHRHAVADLPAAVARALADSGWAWRRRAG